MTLHYIIEQLQHIVDKNVLCYKSDFNYDIYKLVKKQFENKQYDNDLFTTPFFWLARETGTSLTFKNSIFKNNSKPIKSFNDIINYEWMNCQIATIKIIVYYNGDSLEIIDDPETIRNLQLKAYLKSKENL